MGMGMGRAMGKDGKICKNREGVKREHGTKVSYLYGNRDRGDGSVEIPSSGMYMYKCKIRVASR